MTSRFVRYLLPCLLLLALTSPSSAGSRRSSLAGNLLIPDAEDIFIFPHLVTAHKRLVTFDLGPNAGLGSGGIIFGDEKLSFGAFAHRSDFPGATWGAFTTIGDVENFRFHGTTEWWDIGSLGYAPLLGGLNWIDAMVGCEAAGMPWGLRYSMGHNLSEHGSTKKSITTINAILGTHLNAIGADASVEFSYTHAETDSAGTAKISPYFLSLAARSTTANPSDNLVVGWLGNLNWAKATGVKTPADPADGAAHHLDVIAGVGPVYKPNDRTNIAMYGTLEFNQGKHTPTGAGSVEEKFTIWTLPGWNIAAEMDVASWLQVRAGLRSSFTFIKVEPGPNKTNDHPFQWTSGVGIHVNNLQIDGYLDPAVVTTGTDLLGNNDSIFGLVTASYHF
jgi:hypothetical protein